MNKTAFDLRVNCTWTSFVAMHSANYLNNVIFITVCKCNWLAPNKNFSLCFLSYPFVFNVHILIQLCDLNVCETVHLNAFHVRVKINNNFTIHLNWVPSDNCRHSKPRLTWLKDTLIRHRFHLSWKFEIICVEYYSIDFEFNLW